MNCCLHCITETLGREISAVKTPLVSSSALLTHEEVQSTRHDFLIVQAAVIPTSVLPAPQGNTIIPDRARLEYLEPLSALINR